MDLSAFVSIDSGTFSGNDSGISSTGTYTQHGQSTSYYGSSNTGTYSGNGMVYNHQDGSDSRSMQDSTGSYTALRGSRVSTGTYSSWDENKSWNSLDEQGTVSDGGTVSRSYSMSDLRWYKDDGSLGESPSSWNRVGHYAAYHQQDIDSQDHFTRTSSGGSSSYSRDVVGEHREHSFDTADYRSGSYGSSLSHGWFDSSSSDKRTETTQRSASYVEGNAVCIMTDEYLTGAEHLSGKERIQ